MFYFVVVLSVCGLGLLDTRECQERLLAQTLGSVKRGRQRHG